MWNFHTPLNKQSVNKSFQTNSWTFELSRYEAVMTSIMVDHLHSKWQAENISVSPTVFMQLRLDLS